MVLFAEHDFDVQYRLGPQNANADYLLQSSTAKKLVLSICIEDDLKLVVGYLTTKMFIDKSLRFAKAIKVRAKNHVMHDGQLYRGTIKSLCFIPAEQERIVIMEDSHDLIRHLNFART